MTRTAWTLAALVDAAVTGVHPTRVEELVDRVGERFRVGFVEDSDGRRWVVRVPVDAVAAAVLEESGALTQLLAGHVPFAVPRPAGAVSLRDGRRAVVTPLIPGQCISFAALAPGPGLTTHVARAIAAIHNVDRGLFEEAGVPAYDAEDCRRRRQADVDRGAATGLVPTGLLARWERMLDDISWWRFAPTPVHGRLQEDHLLLAFDDEMDSATGRVVGVTSWEDAQIADPAQDIAALLALCPTDSTDTVMEAYAAARSEPPDAHLAQRASLLAELEYLTELLTARRVGDRTHLSQATEALRRLDDAVSADSESGNRSGTSVDRLPVDFEPAPVAQDWYRAGSPTAPATSDTHSVYHAAGAQQEPLLSTLESAEPLESAD
ncbi:MAG: phosphotransferase, partial [Micrococcales bacterium]|nr:phosphotransferase [Micrococcales bacterium]